MGGQGKNFSPWTILLFCKSPGPFSRAWVTKPVFAASAFSGGLFLIYVVFISKSRWYQFVFSPANKMYFICSKEKEKVVTAAWGWTEFLQFLAALAILQQDEIILSFQSSWCNKASAARSWINSVPKQQRRHLHFRLYLSFFYGLNENSKENGPGVEYPASFIGRDLV